MIFKIIIDQENPQHVHFRLFAGKKEGSMGLTGRLIMRQDEYAEFKVGLKLGGLKVLEEDNT